MSRPTTNDIAKAVNAMLEKNQKSSVIKALSAYLVSERRSSDLDKIMRSLKATRTKDFNVVEVDVTSAFPLEQSTLRLIKSIVNSDNLVINQTVDKNIIGGVRLETSETVLDLTLRNRLNKFKNAKVGVEK